MAQGHNERGILATEVARIRGVTQANFSQLASGLMGRGLVRQRGDAHDARRRRLVLTDRGRATLNQIEPFRQEANRLLLSDLSATERGTFVKCLHRCLDRLQLDREDSYLPTDARTKRASPPRRKTQSSRGRSNP
ncbi:MAG: winged helix-turn-helix transcriptional regulator [Vicinamibacteria bacterium]|nr:winged helix-turn-helix transcriptional regulator [Vicinamibacteria bacterium]